MKPNDWLMVTVLTALICSGSVTASQYATAEEARAMLERAIVLLEKDKSEALVAFNDPDGRFRDKDLYVFCAGPDGRFTAHPRAVGRDLKSLRDITRKAFGEEMYRVATVGRVDTVSYMINQGRGSLPREKTSFITRAGDQICGVGYFKPNARTINAVNDFTGPAIEGYDPVAYFTVGRAEQGSQQFSHKWLDAEWWFMSARHRDLFVQDPIRYMPQYGGYCAAAMAEGAMAAADPTIWQIVDGKLYLMYSDRSRKRWVEDPQTEVASAAEQWEKLRAQMPE